MAEINFRGCEGKIITSFPGAYMLNTWGIAGGRIGGKRVELIKQARGAAREFEVNFWALPPLP